MSKIVHVWWLAAALLVSMVWPAAAEVPARLGLFAGFADYTRTPGWIDLPANRRDATDMHRMFAGWGYQAPAPLVDPSRAGLQDALNDLGRQVRTVPAGSLIVVYVSAHGFGYAGDNFVVPGDAGSFDDLSFAERTISVSQILDKLGTRSDVTRVIILDMCRDRVLGKGAPGFLVGKNNEPVTAPVDRGRAPPSGTLVVYSSGYGQRSLPAVGGAQHSLFTEVALAMLAQKPDALFYDVFHDIRDVVAGRTERAQVPMFEGAARGFSLKPAARPSSVPPPADQGALAFSAAVVSRDPVQLLKFIREFPDAADQVAAAWQFYAEWTGSTPVLSATEAAAPATVVTRQISAVAPTIPGGPSPAAMLAEDKILSDELFKRVAAGKGIVQKPTNTYSYSLFCSHNAEVSSQSSCPEHWGMPREEVISRLEQFATSGQKGAKLMALHSLIGVYSRSDRKSGPSANDGKALSYLDTLQREAQSFDEKFFLVIAYLDMGHAFSSGVGRFGIADHARAIEYYRLAWTVGEGLSAPSRQAGLLLARLLERGYAGHRDLVAAFRIYKELSSFLPAEQRDAIEEIDRVVSSRLAAR